MTKKAPCYTCKKTNKPVIETEDTIPKWYSKSKGAFSPYLAVPTAIVCDKKYDTKKKMNGKLKHLNPTVIK